jgi:hypothetical protein
MRIEGKVHLHHGIVPCFTCDEPFELEAMSWFAYADDGKRLGVLCAECMTLDADGIRARLSHRAERLRQHAARFEELATGSIQLPSAEDYARVSELKMRLHVGGHEEIILS